MRSSVRVCVCGRGAGLLCTGAHHVGREGALGALGVLLGLVRPLLLRAADTAVQEGGAGEHGGTASASGEKTAPHCATSAAAARLCTHARASPRGRSKRRCRRRPGAGGRGRRRSARQRGRERENKRERERTTEREKRPFFSISLCSRWPSGTYGSAASSKPMSSSYCSSSDDMSAAIV